jgi:hypothetical protein
MRKMLILSGLLLSTNGIANAQIANDCALFRSPTGEIKNMDQMNDLQADLLREARRGRIEDMSIPSTHKERAASEARRKEAERVAAEKRARVEATLANYKCIQDIYGHTPERG